MLGDGNIDLEEFVAFVKSWKRQGGKEPQRAVDLVYVSMRLAQLTKRAILGRGEINDMVWAHIEKHELQTGRGDGAWIEWDSVLERIFGSSRSEGDDHDGADKQPPKKEKPKKDAPPPGISRQAFLAIVDEVIDTNVSPVWQSQGALRSRTLGAPTPADIADDAEEQAHVTDWSAPRPRGRELPWCYGTEER